MGNTTAGTPSWAEHSTKANKKLSQTLFFLSAYSLTGAALMGSSIGLVVYQSRRFFFLNTSTRFELFHPQFNHSHDPFSHPHHRFDHGPDSDQSHPHHPHHPHHHSFLGSFFLSAWLPVLIWFIAFILSSSLLKAQKSCMDLIPKVIPARAGILISQSIFAMFWIILGAIQEVQERLLAQRNASRLDLAPIVADVVDYRTNGDIEMEMSLEMKSQVDAMAVPLCTIWYLAVVLLGISTGLLTACSSLMEKQLEMAYQDAVVESDVVMEKWSLIEKYTDEEKVDKGRVLAMIPETPRQKVFLVGLVLVLFSSQMKLFHWIIRAQSVAAYNTGTATSVSTCLTAVGLLSGTVMLSLGSKFLPRVPS